jgi:HPt (histidine-containing phosphotransfer) domain-containing protein
MSSIAVSETSSADVSSPNAYQLPDQDLQDLTANSPIDYGALREQCLNNLDFAFMLLDEFEQTSESRLASFDAALAKGDPTEIASQAHGLRGVAGILGARDLMEVCATLEANARSQAWPQIDQLVRQLHQEMQRAINFIPRIRSLA